MAAVDGVASAAPEPVVEKKALVGFEAHFHHYDPMTGTNGHVREERWNALFDLVGAHRLPDLARMVLVYDIYIDGVFEETTHETVEGPELEALKEAYFYQKAIT